MLFSHDTVRALACAVDLVNSTPSPRSEDQLGDLDALGDLVSRHAVSDVTRLTLDDLAAVHRLRALIRLVFTAESDEAAVGVVNVLVSEAPVTPRLSDHDGHAWHVH